MVYEWTITWFCPGCLLPKMISKEIITSEPTGSSIGSLGLTQASMGLVISVAYTT